MTSSTEMPVRSYHIDHFGHVNHARWLELLEEARWRYLEQHKLLGMLHQHRLFHVVAEINIRYRRGARLGDVLRIETEIESRRGKTFVVRQTVFDAKSHKRVADAAITNVFVDEHGTVQSIDETVLNLWPDLAHAKTTLPKPGPRQVQSYRG